MTDAFYNNIRDNVADRLIVEKGTALTLKEEGSGAVFDGATGFITTPGTPVTHSVTGLFVEYKQDEIDDTNVLRTDFKVLMSAVDPTTSLPIVVPTTEMILLDGAREYTIVDVRPLRPGNVDVIYKLQVRK